MFSFDQPAYQSLRSLLKERTNPVFAWIGSGLSASADLPTWPALRTKLATALESKARYASPPEADHLTVKMAMAAAQPNPWIAFDMLYDAIGDTTYKETIRDALTPIHRADIPPVYKALARVGVSGIINANLDRFATTAMNERHRRLNEFTGKQAGTHAYLLKAPDPVVVNIHGTLADSTSWIFRKSELVTLLSDLAYRTFINTCLISKTMLFLGITADDIAVGGHLEALRQIGVQSGTHYWITDRTDAQSNEWAEAVGIRLIRYVPTDASHKELLNALTDIEQYTPIESSPAPVTRRTVDGTPAILPEPRDLLKRDTDEVRELLNSHASRLIANPTTGRQAYEDFRQRYGQAIYQAWYVSTSPGENMLLGYKLEEEIASGAFGTVYRATDRSGNTVAVKVLHERVRRDLDMLEGFRRGVQSMRILSKRDVAGMVPYIDASEIPAFVAMDFIHGPNLHDAVTQRLVESWSDVLQIAHGLTRIIRDAHQLPERVLHRDIRPTNVMLQDYYTDPEECKVVVLDFDLSWHLDATGASVMNSETMSGYLAPEQVTRSTSASTRNAAVDSYGTGMTLLFLATGNDPRFGEHRYAEWEKLLSTRVMSKPCSEWRSLPIRYARLIQHATRDNQNERWDMSQIYDELQRLQQAAADPSSVQSAELVAEELAARSDLGQRYRWEPDTVRAIIRLISGVEVTIAGVEIDSEVTVSIIWEKKESDEHRRVSKWIGNACDQAAAALRSSGLRTRSVKKHSELSHVIAVGDTAFVRTRLQDIADAITKAAEYLTFK